MRRRVDGDDDASAEPKNLQICSILGSRYTVAAMAHSSVISAKQSFWCLCFYLKQIRATQWNMKINMVTNYGTLFELLNLRTVASIVDHQI